MLPNPFEQIFEELQAIRKEQEDLKSRLASAGNLPCVAQEIINTETLCTRLNITEPTAIRHRKRGLIPYMQIGSAVRYNWPAVVKALENKKKGGKYV